MNIFQKSQAREREGESRLKERLEKKEGIGRCAVR